ncbi:MAG: DUF5703 domain-containing protein [Verrucomicrobiota bacterium]|nr:DUF5703 domain-containing protein [Limisphaera sp.]MDW8380936.1 DUF5703 domain-containing protein [Verrucomicrobiota bacterium]
MDSVSVDDSGRKEIDKVDPAPAQVRTHLTGERMSLCPFGGWGRFGACLLGLWAGALFVAKLSASQEADAVSRYHVIWHTPSTNHHGSMPLGNGEVAVNAWMTSDGQLHCYLSRSDAWDEYGRLVKVGKIRWTLEPNPFRPNDLFRQELQLRSGTMEIVMGKTQPTRLRLWVDANLPIVFMTVESSHLLTVTATIELWRTNRQLRTEFEVSDVLRDHPQPDSDEARMELTPDAVLSDFGRRVGWYHYNQKSVGPAWMARLQGLEGFPQTDPLLHRIFGAIVEAEKGVRLNDHRIQSGPDHHHLFRVAVTGLHPSSPQAWQTVTESLLDRLEQESLHRRRMLHEAWWEEFWARSWIRAERAPGAKPVLPALVPSNTHPVRVGMDRDGGNRWSGQIGRLTIWNRPLDENSITSLATTAWIEDLAGLPAPLVHLRHPDPQVLPDSANWQFSDGLTVEAWIRPNRFGIGGARIVDRVTPGVDDGFLLDTWPGNSLRLICGAHTLRVPKGAPAGQWTHVAAVADPVSGRCRLYVDGQLQAETQGIPQADTDEAFWVSQMYHLQRFLTAAAGRGRYPIKFNGSLFTVPPGPTEEDPDYRRWGPGYWWQNTRLPYYAMCGAGDFDLMEPLFRMYIDALLPLCLYRTRMYLGHEGAFYPECMMFWGAIFSETYGWEPFANRSDKLQVSRWHKWEWVGGLELAWLALDYYEHTLDTEFLHRRALPVSREVLKFFECHYPTNASGQLVFYPSQALETWWDCTNAAPEVVGCRAVSERLLRLPPNLVPESDRQLAHRLLLKLPPVPLHKIQGKWALAPAESFSNKRNTENPELYAVFPFRLYAFNRPHAELAFHALEYRSDRGHAGWRQDDLFMAYLGLTRETQRAVVERAWRRDPKERFPAFWGPNFDWTPDQCHGAVLMRAFQAMVLQSDGSSIYLLPAWPRDWNLEFKLHAPGRTVVEGQWLNGKFTRLRVDPPDRMRDIVVLPPR